MGTVVVQNFAAQTVAESHGDLRIVIKPHFGPKAGVACEVRTVNDASWSPNIGADHVMGNGSISAVAVAHTEAKPGGSMQGFNAREQRRVVEHMGGVLTPFDMQWFISRPGLPTDTYEFPGAIWHGDFGGLQTSSGDIPKADAEFLVANVKLNGKWIIRDGRDDVATNGNASPQ